MFDIADFNSKVNAVLTAESKILANNIKANIVNQYTINDYMRNAANAVVDEVDGNTLIIWSKGRANFENVEKGIPPLTGFACRNLQVWRRIYEWSIKAGMSFEKDRVRRSWAYFTRKNIFEHGTKLYQRGGKTTIYTDEANMAVQRIKDEIGEVFINTKIL